jgi:N-formylglutamate deformylase
LRDLGYGVAFNDPYKGVELVRKHGRPAENRHSLQVEVNRRLYMDELTLMPNDGYAKLERDLEKLLSAVAWFVRRSLV